jgi:hypothetical protein
VSGRTAFAAARVVLLELGQVVGAIRRVWLEADLELVFETHGNSCIGYTARTAISNARLARRFWTGEPSYSRRYVNGLAGINLTDVLVLVRQRISRRRSQARGGKRLSGTISATWLTSTFALRATVDNLRGALV